MDKISKVAGPLGEGVGDKVGKMIPQDPITAFAPIPKNTPSIDLTDPLSMASIDLAGPPSPESQLQSRVLDSMGDSPPGTSVHDRPGGSESYWAKVAKERPLTSDEKRWREKGRDQFGYTKMGNEQKKKNFRNNIFLE